MPSPAFDDFNAYIAARKAAVDTYVASKKTQVDAFNTARKAQVTASTLSNAEKTLIRGFFDGYTVDIKALFDTTATDTKTQILDVFVAKGEDFYVRVVKEYNRHLRKHIAAAKAGGGDAAICDLLDAIAINQDAEADHVIVAFAKAL